MSNSQKQGVIYILTNPSFKEYVKIGYANDIEKRLKQLNRSETITFLDPRFANSLAQCSLLQNATSDGIF